MNVTTTGLTKGAAAAAVAAGTIFVAVQIKHPPMTVATVDTTDWLIRSGAKMVMAALALAGITGMYLRQVRETRLLGLIGYLFFAAGYLIMFGAETIATVVLPSLTSTEPGYVNDVIVAAFGGKPTGDIGQHADSALRHGYRLPAGRPALRHRDVQGWHLGPLGRGAAGCRHGGDRRSRGPAGLVQPALRRPGRHRTDRPRRLPLARPGPPGPLPLAGHGRRVEHHGSRARSPMTTPSPSVTRPVGPPRRAAGGAVPIALILLSAIPLLAGTFRLIQLAGGPEVMPADERFAGFPAPLVVHLLGAALYALVGAFQFVPRFRRRHLTWHRRAGRVLAHAGLLVAGSALWMTLLYSQKPGTGDLLYVFRLVFASAMAACLVLGVTAVRRRDIDAHRAWMIRAYAIGLAAGTQAFTEGIVTSIFGTGVISSDLAKGAGWVINLAIAEWAIRRATTSGTPRRTGSRTAVAAQPLAAGAQS